MKNTQKKPSSKQKHVLLSLLLLVCLSAVFVFTQYLRQKEQQQFAELEKSAVEVAQKIDMNMQQRFEEVENLAKNSEIANLAVSSDRKRAALESIQNQHPEYAWIGVTNNQGNVVASVRSMLEKQDVSARPWYQGSQEKTFVGDVHEALLLAKLLPNASGEPLRFVDIATPIFDTNNNKIGVLGAHLSWTWIRDMEAEVLSTEDAQNIEALIISQDRTVLAGPKDLQGKKIELELLSKAVTMNSAASLEMWPDKKEYITAFAKTQGYQEYPGLGWIILVRKSAQ